MNIDLLNLRFMFCISVTGVANELEAIKPIEAFKETEAARELSTLSFAENNDIHTSAEEDAKLKHRKTDAKRGVYYK